MINKTLATSILLAFVFLTGCSASTSDNANKAGEQAGVQAGKLQTFARNNLELQCNASSDTESVSATPTFGADQIQTEVTDALSSALLEAAGNSVKSRLPGGSSGGGGFTQAMPIVKEKLTAKLAKVSFNCGDMKDPNGSLSIGIKPNAPQKDRIGILKELDPKLSFPLKLSALKRSTDGTYSVSKTFVPQKTIQPGKTQNEEVPASDLNN